MSSIGAFLLLLLTSAITAPASAQSGGGEPARGERHGEAARLAPQSSKRGDEREAAGSQAAGSQVVLVPERREPELIVLEPRRLAVRPRFGLSVLGGWTGDGPEGGLVGLSVRLGAQLGDWFSVYLQPTALVASLASPSGGADDIALIVWAPLLAEVMLFDTVSIAAGPSLDVWLDCDPRLRAQSSCAANDGDPSFGLHGRVAAQLGVPMQRGRAGLSLSFEIHPTWFAGGGQSIALLGGLGGEIF